MSETAKAIKSTVGADGSVRVTIVEEPVPEPGADEVVVAVEAAPINPSDLGMLLAGADPSTLEAGADGALVARLGAAALRANAARVDTPSLS